jgi:hypothetical protein
VKHYLNLMQSGRDGPPIPFDVEPADYLQALRLQDNKPQDKQQET